MAAKIALTGLIVAPDQFVNQARWSVIGMQQPARAWFLEIDSVRIVSMCVCLHVCVCVCLPPRLLITSGMMWHDIDPIRLVKQILKLLYGNCSRYC